MRSRTDPLQPEYGLAFLGLVWPSVSGLSGFLGQLLYPFCLFCQRISQASECGDPSASARLSWDHNNFRIHPIFEMLFRRGPQLCFEERCQNEAPTKGNNSPQTNKGRKGQEKRGKSFVRTRIGIKWEGTNMCDSPLPAAPPQRIKRTKHCLCFSMSAHRKA